MLPNVTEVWSLELLVLYQDRYVILDDKFDLASIVFNFWERKGPLLLFYRAVGKYTGANHTWPESEQTASSLSTPVAVSVS